MNVAQLKRISRKAASRITAWFPRSNERGSIEAKTYLAGAYRLFKFPRSNERGSIEAPQHPLKRRDGEAFPRSNERGSIEAFRRRKPDLLLSEFPRSNERGSIEAAPIDERTAHIHAVSTFE